MAFQLAAAFVRIGATITPLRSALATARGLVLKTMKSLTQAVASLAMRITATIGAIGTAALAYSAKVGSDAHELENMFQAVFKEGTRDAKEFAEVLSKKLGRSTLDVIQKLLTAEPRVRLAVLLGINAGMGLADMLKMQPDELTEDVYLSQRSKNAKLRKCVLWGETIRALEDVGYPRDHWKNEGYLDRAFVKAERAVGVEHIRQRGLYGLRRSLQVIAEELEAERTVDVIVGHKPADVGLKAYTKLERYPVKKLRAVADYVRGQIF